MKEALHKVQEVLISKIPFSRANLSKLDGLHVNHEFNVYDMKFEISVPFFKTEA